MESVTAKKEGVRLTHVFRSLYFCAIKYSSPMRIINEAELSDNVTKYLDLAKDEKIIIQRGSGQTFVLEKEEYLDLDDDFRRAITAEELMVRVEKDIREAFRRRSQYA